MTALLEQAVSKARLLPEDKQNAAAEALLKTLTELERSEQVTPKPGRKVGSAKGLGYMTADFDEPMEDFQTDSVGEEADGPKFGSARGKIWMSPDFDEPLEDFKDYM